MYVRELTTYIYYSYHKTTTLTIEYDTSPLMQMIHILPWCTLGDPLLTISGSYHKAATFVIDNNVSPLEYIINIVRQQNDDRPHCTTMYMYLRGGSRSFHNEGRFISETIFLRNIKKYLHVIQSQNYKTW